MTTISVVIPMFNEERHIERTLSSVMRAAEQAGLDTELIVVDNQSADKGPELARLMGAKVLTYPELTVGGLRNEGALEATGEWLAFLDADIEVPENWLLAALEVLEQGVAAVALDCDTPWQAPWYARAWQMRSMSQTGMDRNLGWLPTPNLLMARATFMETRGFSRQLRSGEDKEFGLLLQSAGLQQRMLASPVALHWGYETSWAEWIRKEFWRQGSHVELLRQQPRVRLLRFPLLCVLTSLLSLLAVLTMLEGDSDVAWMLGLGSLLPALVFAFRQSWRRRRPGYSLQLMFLHWLRMHVGCAALFHSLFRGR